MKSRKATSSLRIQLLLNRNSFICGSSSTGGYHLQTEIPTRRWTWRHSAIFDQSQPTETHKENQASKSGVFWISIRNWIDLARIPIQSDCCGCDTTHAQIMKGQRKTVPQESEHQNVRPGGLLIATQQYLPAIPLMPNLKQVKRAQN